MIYIINIYMIISVDTDQIKKLAEDAKGIYTTLEAEQTLIKLLSMQKKIEEGDSEKKS